MAARAPVCAFVQSVALRVNRTDLSHIWNWSTIKALFPPPVVLQIGGVGGGAPQPCGALDMCRVS